MNTNYRIGSTVILKKKHACSPKAHEFLVLETGAVCKIRCLSCGHEIIMTRDKLNQSVVKIKS